MYEVFATSSHSCWRNDMFIDTLSVIVWESLCEPSNFLVHFNLGWGFGEVDLNPNPTVLFTTDRSWAMVLLLFEPPHDKTKPEFRGRRCRTCWDKSHRSHNQNVVIKSVYFILSSARFEKWQKLRQGLYEKQVHIFRLWRKYVQSFKKIGIKLYEELCSRGTYCLYIEGEKWLSSQRGKNMRLRQS